MKNHILANSLSIGLLSLAVQLTRAETNNRPNIILIMADDMGISDLGCYGSEIHTPNLDALAQSGIRYSNFYNGARSCPTRAALLTGLYAHQAGIGWMVDFSEGNGSSYQGDLIKNVITIAEYLKSGGYKTYMSGKWHVSLAQKNNANINDSWPVQRGFEQFFGIVGGAASYFTPTVFRNNSKYQAPANFYMTDAISDTATTYIKQQTANTPFFMYVAYTAPHWPLHARPEDIAKYDGVYDVGWDVIRAQRFQKQKEIGFINQNVTISPRDSEVSAWSSTTDKLGNAKRMQIYAAQIEVLDRGVGRIINELKNKQMLDNTIILFMSDNGACAEFISSGDKTLAALGTAASWESYRMPWANVSNTPYRMYKHFTHEGGIKSPLIVHWPTGITQTSNTWNSSVGHVIDIFKTIEDVVKIPYPTTYNNSIIQPLQGQSLAPSFNGTTRIREPLFWEHEGNIAIRKDEWKLVAHSDRGSIPPGKLELYNLSNDPTELTDLSNTNPEKTKELWDAWLVWSKDKKVYPLNTLNDTERETVSHRYLKEEFDAGISGWQFTTAGTGVGTVAFDQTSQISGPNSARINITTTGSKPNNIVFGWPFPITKGERCRIRFRAKADRNVTMLLRLEENNDNFTKIIDVPVNLNPQDLTYEYESENVPFDDQFKVAFYFGSSVPSSIWIDQIELSYVNNTSLTSFWNFKSIAGADYSLSFDAYSSQLYVPLKVNLRKKDNPNDIYFSETVELSKDQNTYKLKIPAFTQDENLFLEFVYPPYASQACFISNVVVKVDGASLNQTLLDESIFNITKVSSNSYKISARELDSELKVELFQLNGEKIKEISATSEIVLAERNNGAYIIRISNKLNITRVMKLFF